MNKIKKLMTPTAVVTRLRGFNRWRRGEDKRDYIEFGQTPTQIGKDIDFICDYVEKKITRTK
jgi:hypothetical protein